jgi:lipid II:glycine glycyltransferase (peptidoglycan interpeptide bridge formation enzyme)
MIEFVERSNIAEADWNDVVLDSPDGWVFALFAWQDLIVAVSEWGLRDHSFAVAAEGRLIAAVPLQFNPGTGGLGMSAWGGCGPIIRERIAGQQKSDLLNRIYENCRNIAVREKAARLEFAQSATTNACISNRYGVNHSLFHGFEDRSGLTQVIDLTPSLDDLWSGLSKNARNIIRRAEKSGFYATQVDWLEHLDRYYALHCETYKRTGVAPHPYAYFSGIAEKMGPSGHAALFAAFDDRGEVLAYHNDACFSSGALYHTGCSASNAQDKGANYLLLWRAIVASKEAGRMVYEVGPIFPNASDPKQRGLTLFKTRFGGSPRRAMRSTLIYPVKSDSGVAGHDAGLSDEVGIIGLSKIVAARILRGLRRSGSR